MPIGKLGEIIRQIRPPVQDDVNLTDTQLLDHFTKLNDPTAIGTLVRRHGPMVWGVCRRILGNHHDAEDAFQATFLVFVSKATTICPSHQVAAWLYGVARKTALYARSTIAKTKVRERQVEEMPEPETRECEFERDQLDLLEVELRNLPERYRTAIVLCDLEGKTRREAAVESGVPEGTLSSWLNRGRAMLAKRLIRHGISFSAVAVLFTRDAASGEVPKSILFDTIHLTSLWLTGQRAASEAMSTNVSILMEGVLKSMFLNKLKTLVVLLVVVLTLTVGAVASLTATGTAIEAKKTAQSDTKVDPEKELKAGEEREFEIAAGVKMKFCWIPAGEARLGSPQAERVAVLERLIADEKEIAADPDAKKVEAKAADWLAEEAESKRGIFRTKGFWLGKYQVTQQEWKTVMGDNPSWFQPTGRGEVKLKQDGIRDTSRFPVECVSWDDSQRFLQKLNERGGIERVFEKKGTFALPHEDQWEYACRGGRGNKQAYYFGTELNGTQSNCGGYQPFGTTTKGQYLDRPCEVDFTNNGKYELHPWGLCHMNGNVWQWCENLYEKTKYRVLRGGSWYGIARACRSAFRVKDLPDGGDNHCGFRVCLQLKK